MDLGSGLNYPGLVGVWKSGTCCACFTMIMTLGYGIECLTFSLICFPDRLWCVQHYMTKSMWTTAHRTPHSKIMGINMELVPPFAAITASTLLRRLFTRYWNLATGTCFHSATRGLMRSGTDVRQLDLARSWCSNSPQRCSMGLGSGLWTDQSSSSTPISTKHFCMDLALCMGAFPKLLLQSWKHRIVYVIVLLISLPWN